jgi:hypothetical protein
MSFAAALWFFYGWFPAVFAFPQENPGFGGGYRQPGRHANRARSDYKVNLSRKRH